MKNVLGFILIIALGGGGYYFWSHQTKVSEEERSSDQIGTTVAELRDISFAVSAAGEIGPAEQVSVRPEINGRVISLPVDIGDKVKKGDVLFTLDDQELRNEQESSLTDVDRAKLQLAQTARNFERAKQLFEDKLISEEEFENFKTEQALAQNALERSQKQLALVAERLTKTKIVAPFDCTVLSRPVSIGQAVSGSGGVGGGTEVLAIADLNEMIIQAHINQADVTRLRTGQKVTVQVEAVSSLSVTGIVERIAPQATIKNNIKGFLARVLLRKVDPLIRPGMTANITIPVGAAEDVVAVPLSAVFTEYNQQANRTERFVYVKNGNRYVRRDVTIGLADFFHAEIRQGLEAGEEVTVEQPPANLIAAPPSPVPSAAQDPALNASGGSGKSSQNQSTGSPVKKVALSGAGS